MSLRRGALRRGRRQARQAGATRSAGEPGLPGVRVSGAAPSLHEGLRRVGHGENGPRVEEVELEREPGVASSPHLQAGGSGRSASRTRSCEAAGASGRPEREPQDPRLLPPTRGKSGTGVRAGAPAPWG